MKGKIKRNFSKSAAIYDENSALQRSIGDKLISKLNAADISPQAVLDVGAGTARDSVKLAAYYPDASITACDIAHGMMTRARTTATGLNSFVTADMERLPFKSDTFDLVYSNAALHWAEDLKRVFAVSREIIKESGTFCFSTFGADTLSELTYSFNDAYRQLNKAPKEHVNKFTPFEKIILELNNAGFHNVAAEVEERKVYYKDVKEFLKALKAIGSHKAEASPTNSLTGSDFFRRVIDAYESNFKENGRIYATYVIYYFMCRI